MEVVAAVGADGEFARPGHAGAGGGEQPQDLGNDVLRSVAGDLGGILAGVGAGCTEYRDQHVVQYAAVVHDLPVVYRVSCCCGQRFPAAEDTVADAQRLLPADADDG